VPYLDMVQVGPAVVVCVECRKGQIKDPWACSATWISVGAILMGRRIVMF
jgi:hypothetical protein